MEWIILNIEFDWINPIEIISEQIGSVKVQFKFRLIKNIHDQTGIEIEH